MSYKELGVKPERIIYDVDNWRRLGRGHDQQFFATDDEVQNWLLMALPRDYEPYTLVGADLIKTEKKYIEHGFEFNINDLKNAMYENEENVRWKYWIRSKKLTPELDYSKNRRVSVVLSYSGLISLQHGGYIKDMGRDNSSIGLVDKIINDNTGEEIVHKSYLKI